VTISRAAGSLTFPARFMLVAAMSPCPCGFHGDMKRQCRCSSRQMKVHCQIDAEATGYLEHAMEEMNFSARAHDRILKVARTLADLAGSENIRPADVLEAIQYRSLDRKLFS
jgi:magnesium chelatase family protein